MKVNSRELLHTSLPDWKRTPIRPGDSVQIRSGHPHAHRIGTYKGIDYIDTMQKYAALVAFDDDTGCYVFKKEQWERA